MSIQVVKKRNHPDCTYIGRGSALGNPFVAQQRTLAERNRVCNEYAAWFDVQVKLKDSAVRLATKQLFLRAKRGEDIKLGCFCAPQRCHGDHIKAFLEEHLC